MIARTVRRLIPGVALSTVVASVPSPRANAAYPTSNVFVMSALGTNPNVMCYLDDIYAYLKARSDGAIGRGRPEHKPVAQAVLDQGDACLGFTPSH
jgi:hypothetical protein